MLERIEKARKHNGKYKVTEDDGRKIGFVNEDKQCSSNVVKCNEVDADDPYYEDDDEDDDEPYELEGYGEPDEPCNQIRGNRIIPLHER